MPKRSFRSKVNEINKAKANESSKTSLVRKLPLAEHHELQSAFAPGELRRQIADASRDIKTKKDAKYRSYDRKQSNQPIYDRKQGNSIGNLPIYDRKQGNLPIYDRKQGNLPIYDRNQGASIGILICDRNQGNRQIYDRKQGFVIGKMESRINSNCVESGPTLMVYADVVKNSKLKDIRQSIDRNTSNRDDTLEVTKEWTTEKNSNKILLLNPEKENNSGGLLPHPDNHLSLNETCSINQLSNSNLVVNIHPDVLEELEMDETSWEIISIEESQDSCTTSTTDEQRYDSCVTSYATSATDEQFDLINMDETTPDIPDGYQENQDCSQENQDPNVPINISSQLSNISKMEGSFCLYSNENAEPIHRSEQTPTIKDAKTKRKQQKKQTILGESSPTQIFETKEDQSTFRNENLDDSKPSGRTSSRMNEIAGTEPGVKNTLRRREIAGTQVNTEITTLGKNGIDTTETDVQTTLRRKEIEVGTGTEVGGRNSLRKKEDFEQSQMCVPKRKSVVINRKYIASVDLADKLIDLGFQTMDKAEKIFDPQTTDQEATEHWKGVYKNGQFEVSARKRCGLLVASVRAECPSVLTCLVSLQDLIEDTGLMSYATASFSALLKHPPTHLA